MNAATEASRFGAARELKRLTVLDEAADPVAGRRHVKVIEGASGCGGSTLSYNSSQGEVQNASPD